MRAADLVRTGVLALLLCAPIALGAQQPGAVPLAQDCDPNSVEGLQPDPPMWVALHPSAVRTALKDTREGRLVRALDGVRDAFDRTPARQTPEAAERFIPQLDALRALLTEHALVTAPGAPVPNSFNPDVAPEGDRVTLFPGFREREIVLTEATPADVRRGFCWAAISVSFIIDADARKYRDALLKRLDSAVEMWDNYTDEGYSQYPWELFVNGLGGRGGGGIDPPRRQWILLHPTIGVSLSGSKASSLRRLDVIPLEILGYLWYNERRTAYRGISLVSSFATDADPSVGPFLHVGRGVSVGATWRGWGDDTGFGGVLFSADLYRALAGVPGDVQERVRELREALASNGGGAAPAAPAAP
jgi:hypothetical protein